MTRDSTDGPTTAIHPPRMRPLQHRRELRVDPLLSERRFADGCTTASCDATCCLAGVQVDVTERDRILSHAALVQRSMDPSQDHDPAHWFEVDEVADTDMPSGRAVGTVVRDGACVFLNGARRCVLQLASSAMAADAASLKPFFCWAFPLTIFDGTLTLDTELATRRVCCGPVPDGPLSLLDVCATELDYVLGDGGSRALRARVSGPVPPAAAASGRVLEGPIAPPS